MRIAQCLEYPIQQHGGTEVLVRELIAGLASQHEIVLVSPDDAASLGKSAVAPFVSDHIRWDTQQAWRPQGQALAAALLQRKVDVAHFHSGGNFGWGSRLWGNSPIRAVARRGMRVFSTVHSVGDVLAGYCGPQKPWWFKVALLPGAWLGKMDVLRHLNREIAVSQHDFRRLRRWSWPLRRRVVQIYHSRIRDQDFVPSKPREKLILNVGHIAHRKGQRFLAEAFVRLAAQWPEWNLALVGYVGDADAEREIKAMIASANLAHRVHLTGPRDDTPDWMCRAAIYVQPSLEEALGLALQEAMSFGCACIGTRVGGIPELILPSTGILVERANSQALAESMQHLMEHAEERERLGLAARASIRQRGMTSEAMLARYLELYAVRA